MDPKSKEHMNEYYSKRLDAHGNSIATLVYSSEEQKDKRYALMADIGAIDQAGSVLDVGCGLGHFCEFLRQHGWKGEYTGLDINPNMIEAAKKRLPSDNFICGDLLTEATDKKYDYVFCGATVEHRPKFGDPIEYLKKMIQAMFSITNKTLAFDIFSGRVDYRDEDKLYISPDELLNFCYSLTNRVTLRNDARPYELMMYLYKQESKDEINIYNEWTPMVPRIVQGR